jgi:hypothetical protein
MPALILYALSGISGRKTILIGKGFSRFDQSGKRVRSIAPERGQ